MNLKTVTIADLEPHPDNPNTHPTKQVDALGDSLDEFDQVKNVVIWRGIMLAGHAVREAAMKSGRLTLDAVDVSHWDEQKATAFMLADIRLPDMGIYDEAAMAEALRDIDEPTDIPGFDEKFLAGLLGEEDTGPKKNEGPTEPGAAEKAQEIWEVKEGDVWQLGRHRIACIDSLDEEAIKGLIGKDEVGMVWADPPYGISEETNRNERGRGYLTPAVDWKPVKGDDKPFNPNFLLSYPSVILWGANYYADKLPTFSSWIVWDKRDGIESDDNADCEMAWTNFGGPARIFHHLWKGAIKASEHGQRRVHPTQKPVVLFEWVANKYFKDGGVIFDPFLGSGISIIGAENIGDSITVIGCEIIPEYIAIIIQRWADLTEGVPQLIK